MTIQNEHHADDKESRLPQSGNHEEETTLWATHDVSGYGNELRSVQLPADLEKAFGESWQRNEPCYRYLAEH